MSSIPETAPQACDESYSLVQDVIREAHAHGAGDKNNCYATEAALLSYVASLDADRKRLDWLDAKGVSTEREFMGALRTTRLVWKSWEAEGEEGQSLREAIDSAMRGG